MSNKFEALLKSTDEKYQVARNDTGEFFGGGPFHDRLSAEQEVESIIKDYDNWNDLRPYSFDPRTQLEIIKVNISYEKL